MFRDRQRYETAGRVFDLSAIAGALIVFLLVACTRCITPSEGQGRIRAISFPVGGSLSFAQMCCQQLGPEPLGLSGLTPPYGPRYSR